jgi:gliding motility-associated-like protein
VKIRLTALTILILFFFCCQAEGTKQLRLDSTYLCQLWIQDGSSTSYSCFGTEHCGADQSLFIHIAHSGEKVYLGFHCDNLLTTSFKIMLNGTMVYSNTIAFSNGSQGNITYFSQALTGPDILDPHGYPALTFTPPGPGDYSIQFPINQPLLMGLFDITVIDTTKTPLVPINGRIWSKDWSFQIYYPFLGTMYVLTTDSIVTSINYNRMQGLNFDVTSTSNGCYPFPEPWDSSCRSRNGNHHYAEYKMFVNNPDSTEYPTGMLGKIMGDTVNITRTCNGSFAFKFVVNKRGTVKLNIEPNLAPGIQPEDLTVNHAVLPGPNTILWNGINALGDTVSCGDSVQITINYINGLTNLSLFDIENHQKGFIIQAVRPPGQPIATYWNDTLLASDGGQLQLSGCYSASPDTGCHTWDGSVGWGLGSQNTVNTWWYAASSALDLGRFSIECMPHAPQGITGPSSLCASSTGTYTPDPDPIPGTDIRGYEWVLTDAPSGTILFDSVNIGHTVKIHFSAWPPGQKRLKVRGKSSICGVGPFGPGAAGEGILINTIQTTQITNTLKSFTICSGDITNIPLQASLAGTTYSYTANASASTTTGYSAGIQNPITQTLVNSGNASDTVFYHVVPYLDPCPGDTITFIVVVNPTDSLNFLIAASANTICTGTVDTFSVISLIGGPTSSYQWYVNGIAAGSNAEVYIYTPVNGDKVQCTIVSPDFCTPGKLASSQEIIMIVNPLATVGVSVTPSVNPVCQGDPVTLSAIPSNGGSSPVYQWQVNGVLAGTDTSFYMYVPANGDRVTCLITSNHPCILNSTTSDTIQIKVTTSVKVVDTTLCYGTPYYAGGAWQTTGGIYHDTLVPTVSCIRYVETQLNYKQAIPVELGRDTTLCGNIITLNPHIQGSTYLWQDGSTDSIYVVTIPGKYRVEVGLDGCFNADSVNIGECPVNVWFPTGFTPNGDGLNDTFRPVGTGIAKFSMQIFNRWGEMVFDTSDPHEGWEGSFNGTPCPDGNYVFKASIGNSQGDTKQATGTISLVH